MTSKRKWNSSMKWGSVTVSRQDISVYRVTHPIATCHWNLTGHSGNPWETLHCSRSLAVCPLSPLVQPPLTAGSALHSDQVPEGYTQLGLEKFQGKRLHNLSGQPVGLPVLMGKQIYLTFSLNIYSFNLCQLSLVFPPFTESLNGCSWQGPLEVS